MPDDVEVPLRWRDLDHQGHVYHATVLTLLDEARTIWLASALGVEAPDSYVVARVEVDYVGEIRHEDARVVVGLGVTRVGRTSLTTREVARTPDGREVVRAAVVAVLWDRARGRPRPLTDDERARAGARLESVPD